MYFFTPLKRLYYRIMGMPEPRTAGSTVILPNGQVTQDRVLFASSWAGVRVIPQISSPSQVDSSVVLPATDDVGMTSAPITVTGTSATVTINTGKYSVLEIFSTAPSNLGGTPEVTIDVTVGGVSIFQYVMSPTDQQATSMLRMGLLLAPINVASQRPTWRVVDASVTNIVITVTNLAIGMQPFYRGCSALNPIYSVLPGFTAGAQDR